MRFISIFSHEPVNRSPTQEEMASMGKLIGEAMQEGWLIATEGVSFGEKGFRVHKDAGNSQVLVTDGPFAEAKEVLGGYALIKADSKAHCIELTKRFLNTTGSGTCEIYQLYEMAHPTK